MKPFLHAHATHPDAHMALALAAAQIEAQREAAPQRSTLGWLYLTEAFAGRAEALLADAAQRWPGVAWVGASGVGISASGIEYFDEPALSVMLAELPPDQFHVFSGTQPLGRRTLELAQVHADGSTPELQDLLVELAERMEGGYLFGGLSSGMRGSVQIADGVWRGGVSGVAFGSDLRLLSRVSQGCQAIGPERRVTASDGPLVTSLDDRPALDCLLEDLGLPLAMAGDALGLREIVPRLRRTLIGVNRGPSPGLRRGDYGDEVLVRHLIGVDPQRRGVAVADRVEPGQRMSFCERNPDAARRDLMRICTELRAEVEESEAAIAGAIYVSCAGRGGPHFGAPSAELQWLRHALGDVPLVGFFAGGEIAHAGLYGYTGVLTLFMADR